MSLDSEAAELELFFLRAALPREIHVPREPIILPAQREAIRQADTGRQLSFAEATDHLVAQPKPVRCRGRLSLGRLSLEVAPPTAEQLQFHNWSLAVPVPRLWERTGAALNDLLKVKSGQDEINVSFGAFDVWERDYIRSGTTVGTGPEALKESSPHSPRWEVGVGYAGPPAESYSLHENERVLCDRCRQQLAVAAFRDRTTTPATLSLLCEDCLRAEAGRELGRAMGIEQRLSDDESHQLLDNTFKSLQDDLRRHSGGAGC